MRCSTANAEAGTDPMHAAFRRGRVASSLFRCVVALLALGPSGAAQARFDFESLRALIETERLTSVEQVVARLPEDLRANYTLVYASQSLQGASHDHPRAVLFGADAKLVLTFNGDPKQRHHDEIEILQYRDEQGVFELRSISFAQGVRFSEKNPQLCLSCHGASPRPIWGSYDYEVRDDNHWPGLYGSTHDAPRLVPEERRAFERYRELAREHPRYRFLKTEHPATRWYPYGDGAYQHRFRPNNRIGNLLARLNARKIAHEIIRNPFFRRYYRTTLSWFIGCPEAAGSEFAGKIERLFEREFDRGRHYRLYGDLGAVRPENRLAFMFEKLLSGLGTYTWNMSVSTLPGGKRFSTGILTIDQLVAAAVLAEVVGGDPWLGGFYRSWTSREVYDTFRPGYYQSNVAPGGVGEQYDLLGLYFDETSARNACSGLLERARAEWHSDSAVRGFNPAATDRTVSSCLPARWGDIARTARCQAPRSRSSSGTEG